ncbi:amidohydrolase family protein [Actinoplanes sp. NPDC049265]|uniref:amidohydrolase family protein n=1 Tax=Actinoplanes sp. NPDC049265 TaxID=3363902 RepID=UPI003719E76A
MVQHRTLLKGGHVLTMDPRLGELAGGDVLIEDGLITAVGAALDVTDAEIVDVTGHVVLPGLIDTHRHTWQTQARAICADWTLTDYFFGLRLAISPAYTPADVHLGNQLGALEALDAGVTTILDFSHCNNSPDHSDAAVRGLLDAGIRATFGYGFFDSSPTAPSHFPDHASRIADFERIAGNHFGSGGLLRPGVALTELGMVPFSRTRAEIEAARRHDALIATHMACVWSMPSGFDELESAGLLGPDLVHIHCNALTDGQWAAVARSGGKVSISVETELNMGMGRPVFAQCERYGIKPTLSCDVVSLNSGDLITQARIGLGFKRWADTEAVNRAGQDPRTVSTTSLQALEWLTVNGADALGLADQVGSLTPGRQADVIVVGGDGVAQHPRPDPAGTLLFQTRPTDVRHVLVQGRFVKRDGALIGHDMARLQADAEESSARVLRRVRDLGITLPGTPAGAVGGIAAAAVANLQI